MRWKIKLKIKQIYRAKASANYCDFQFFTVLNGFMMLSVNFAELKSIRNNL